MDTLVLCYHAVSRDWDTALAVTPEELEGQLEALRARGYVGATFADAVNAPPARKTVAVTFDDAYESVRALAAPVLARIGWPATVFVPSALVGRDEPMSWPGIDHWVGTPHADELKGMGWHGVHELAEEGWEIGSHTLTHPHLTQLDEIELHDELLYSRLEIEDRLGTPCPSIAYPYGDVDDRVMAAAGEAGYAYGATLPDSRATWPRARPLGWPRVGIYPGTTAGRFTLEISPWLRRVRSTPALVPLRAAGALRGRVRRRLTGTSPS